MTYQIGDQVFRHTEETQAWPIEKLREECATKVCGWVRFGTTYARLIDSPWANAVDTYSKREFRPDEKWEHCGLVWDAMVARGFILQLGPISYLGELPVQGVRFVLPNKPSGEFLMFNANELKTAVCLAAVLAMQGNEILAAGKPKGEVNESH